MDTCPGRRDGLPGHIRVHCLFVQDANMGFDKRHLFATPGDDLSPTVTRDGSVTVNQCQELVDRYEEILGDKRHSWTTHLRLLKKLGAGGQGVVYLTERRGSDGFTLPVALKVFSPERYATPGHYDSDMSRMGRVAAKVARIQHENLLVVENFLDRDRIRMMVMEWVEGYDLRRLLTPRMFGTIKERFSEAKWRHINEVVVTSGPEQPRFKAGVAVAIVRDCLEALAAMHREGIVHGDVKSGVAIRRLSILVPLSTSAIRRNGELARRPMRRRKFWRASKTRLAVIWPALVTSRLSCCLADRFLEGSMIFRNCSPPSGRSCNACPRCCPKRLPATTS
jgi:hypothetical protein